MGWWWTGRKSAPDARPFVPAWLNTAGEDEGFARSYSSQFEEVFRKNPVGQRAVRLVAGMLGALPVYAVEGEAKAAQLVQADGLLEGIAANLLLHGNAYVQLIAGSDDLPAELAALRPERVSVVCAVGTLAGARVVIGGDQVVGERAAAIAAPAAGSVVDAEARTEIQYILGAMRQHGLIEM